MVLVLRTRVLAFLLVVYEWAGWSVEDVSLVFVVVVFAVDEF